MGLFYIILLVSKQQSVLLVLPEHKFDTFYNKVTEQVQQNYVFGELPLTKLVPVESDYNYSELDNYSYIVLQSEYGALRFFEELKKRDIQITNKILSVGESVSKVIIENNYQVHYQASIFNLKILMQEIIDEPLVQEQDNILIVGSQQHKKTQAEELLISNSIHYDFWAVYSAEVNNQFSEFRLQEYKYIVLTSPYMVECFVQYSKQINIQNIIFIALGERTRDSLHEYFPDNKCLLNNNSLYSYNGIIEVLESLI